jgi:hypothetical protein
MGWISGILSDITRVCDKNGAIKVEKLFPRNKPKYQDSNKRQILTQEFCIVISIFYRAMQRIVL